MHQGPLHGLIALEFCQSVAGPYAGLILADLGCRVIKIERPGSGDDARGLGTMWDGDSATFLALYERQSTGRGRLIDTSLLEAGLAWLPYQVASYLATGKDPQPMGSAVSIVAPDQAFPTADGHLLVVAGNDHLFGRLCEVLGHPEWTQEPRFRANHDRVQNRKALSDLMSAVFLTDTTAAWEERVTAAGVPCSPMHKISEALAHPQTRALEILRPVPHPRIPDLRLIGAPLHLDGERPGAASAPPDLGAHTAAVLREFGLSAAR